MICIEYEFILVCVSMYLCIHVFVYLYICNKLFLETSLHALKNFSRFTNSQEILNRSTSTIKIRLLKCCVRLVALVFDKQTLANSKYNGWICTFGHYAAVQDDISLHCLPRKDKALQRQRQNFKDKAFTRRLTLQNLFQIYSYLHISFHLNILF